LKNLLVGPQPPVTGESVGSFGPTLSL
jgi:hypothetical protein